MSIQRGQPTACKRCMCKSNKMHDLRSFARRAVSIAITQRTPFFTSLTDCYDYWYHFNHCSSLTHLIAHTYNVYLHNCLVIVMSFTLISISVRSSLWQIHDDVEIFSPFQDVTENSNSNFITPSLLPPLLKKVIALIDFIIEKHDTQFVLKN